MRYIQYTQKQKNENLKIHWQCNHKKLCRHAYMTNSNYFPFFRCLFFFLVQNLLQSLVEKYEKTCRLGSNSVTSKSKFVSRVFFIAFVFSWVNKIMCPLTFFFFVWKYFNVFFGINSGIHHLRKTSQKSNKHKTFCWNTWKKMRENVNSSVHLIL